ncbi:dual specificity tyrosine-phosphorylation-regulated kinase 1A [Drosophila mojavensis]|uniref:Uncharacterized protein n=1 Tax=Drosophila mojavensis TaxID=7230 RepID=B4KVP2_DROMO|nr:dual specificity tyrosine-phosphorylation-regulated kinase 1A [Drosophila mojavensis]EDW18416.1 uncharacterized protein Dmoj_GI13217 [Drosophila mojavensis]
MPSIANISVSSTSPTMVSFLPGNDARLSYIVNQVASASASAASVASVASPALPTFSPPRIESLVASSAEDLGGFGDVTFDIFDDDDDLFGSPMAFDASEQGLWNGRFVPPPPRPPFFVDEPVLSDGLTTCDLCSWAMPTKSTFMFEGTIEKATELGWPLTLIIVSVLSALLGAIIMIAVVRCRRKKSSNNRNDTHVQWWSRNKRAHSNGAGTGSSAGAPIAGSSAHNNNNHLRRSNIYTAHPADSIRGLHPLPLPMSMPMPLPLPMPPTLAATAAPMLAVSPSVAGSAPPSQQQQQQQQPHYFHPYHHHHHHHHQQQQQQQQQAPLPPHYPHDCEEDAAYEEPGYHQPQQLHTSSNSMSSVASSPASTEAEVEAVSHWPQAGTMVVAS